MTIYLIRSPFSQVIYFESLRNHYFCHLFTIPFYWKCAILPQCSYFHSIFTFIDVWMLSCRSCSCNSQSGFPVFAEKTVHFLLELNFTQNWTINDAHRTLQQIVSLRLSLHIDRSLFRFPLIRCFSFPFFSHFIFHSFRIATLSETNTNEHSLSHMNRRLRYTSRTFTYVLIGCVSSFI